jgi:branched-chain amino acid transport system substrate-binding protein
VAYVDDPYGRAVADGAVAEAQSSGQALAGAFAYDAGDVDYAALAGRIAAVRPDVLFVSAYLDDGVALRRAVLDAKIPLLANIGTSSSYCMPAFGAQLGPDAVGLFASDKPDAADVRPDALAPKARPLLAWAASRFRTLYHEAMSAPALSGFSNGLALVAHVLPAARSAAPPDVAAAALATKLAKGSLPNGGGLDLAPPGAPDAGENRAAASVIWEWVAPGQRAVVWPPAFATAAVSALPLRAR